MTDTRKTELANLIVDALENEDFKAAAAKAGSTAELCELMNANGIAASIEEVEPLNAEGREHMADLFDPAAGEMTELGLDMVAGGGKVCAAMMFASSVRISSSGTFDLKVRSAGSCVSQQKSTAGDF